MSTSPIYHTTSTRIAASAGTGKTYRLASRYIALLVLGADPEKIIALTFTKKAAGEFRSRILHALAEGACDIRNKETKRNELTARVWETWSGLTQGKDKSLRAEENVPLLPATRAIVRRAAAEGLYPEELYAEDKELRDYLQLPIADATKFTELLQQMVAKLSRLTLSTLDSFFNTLVTGSSLELGINRITALDPADEPKARRDTIADYLENSAADEAKRADFLRRFAELTGGRGTHTVSRLEKELKAYLSLYRAHPSVDAWGEDSVFAQDCTKPFFALSAEEAAEWTRKAEELSLRLRRMNEKQFPNHVYNGLKKLMQQDCDLSDTAKAWCKEDLSAAGEQLQAISRLRDAYHRKEPWTEELAACAEKASALVQTKTVGATTRISTALGNVCKQLQSGKNNAQINTTPLKDFVEKMQGWLGVQYEAHQLHADLPAKILADAKARTRSLYSLLRDYADTYEDRIKTTGEFSFDDISRKARLLMESMPQVAEDVQRGDFCREHLALRTGRSYTHWMLDEFQDTSDGQFATLAPVLEGIATDAYEGKTLFSAASPRPVPASLLPYQQDEEHCVAEGSIFVVGDAKQGIYGFRTGVTKAFEQLGSEEPWSTPIRGEELLKSYRSSPVIMGRDGFVNTLFTKLNKLEAEDAAENALDLSDYTKHDTAKTFPGYVRLEVETDEEPTAESNDNESRNYRALCRVLSSLTEGNAKPKNGMSIAVLTRSNEQAQAIVDELKERMRDLPVMLVKDTLSAVTTPLGEVLLHFFRWLRHPEEGFSLGVVQASFLRFLLRDGEKAERAWARCRRELEEHGYAAMLRRIAEPLAPEVRREHSELLGTWLKAARDYDAAGGALDKWVRHIATLSSAGVTSKSYVQVMTMHQSKGLEFDAVILPLTTKSDINDPSGQKCFISADESAILLSPAGAEVRNSFWPGAFDKTSELWKKNKRKDAYNLLYVAATRAKRANYVLLHNKPIYKEDGTLYEAAYSEAGLVRRAFGLADAGNIHEMGDPEWYRHMEQNEQTTVTYTAGTQLPLGRAVARRRRISPSSLAEQPVAAAQDSDKKSFVTLSLNSAEFGTKVHALFEQMEWWQEGAPLPFADEVGEAADVVRAALQVPEIASIFRPQDGLAAYNEQPMDAILSKDGEEVWVSAIIDRLVLERTLHTEKQPDGTIIEHEDVTAAHIIDYKTNKRDPKLSAERQDEALRKEYQGQMSAYRELISAAFGLSADKVSVTLVSVPSDGAPARLVPVPLE